MYSFSNSISRPVCTVLAKIQYLLSSLVFFFSFSTLNKEGKREHSIDNPLLHVFCARVNYVLAPGSCAKHICTTACKVMNSSS